MITEQYKRQIIQDTSDAGLILFEFYYSRMNHNYFNPKDNSRIGQKIGWSAKKVERVRKQLKDNHYILILSDTNKDKSKLYRTLLGQEIVEHYIKNGEIDWDEDASFVISNED